MEILIIHPGALGDIILGLPALRILRQHYPAATITLAADSDFARATAAGYADKILSLSILPLHRLYGAESISAEDVTFWKGYDRILSWTGRGDPAFAKKFEQLHSDVIVAPWKPEANDPRHVSRIFVDSMGPWIRPLSGEVPLAEIQVAPASRCEGEAWLRRNGFSGARPLFASHPGAGSAAKRWPIRYFQELMEKLCVLGDLLIIAGPAEPGLAQRLAGARSQRLVIADSLPLSLLAGVMSHARLFVGNDSGIAHLAAGLNISSIVLFGPTLPDQWAPRGLHVTALRRAGNCAACSRILGRRHTCLDDISPATVLSAIENRFGNSMSTQD